MSKFNYLFKNMGFMFIGNFSSKILVFLLVPVYTNALSTSEYGSYDLMYATIQFLVPILSLNVVDGILRFTLDESESKQKAVFTLSLKYILISFCLVLFIVSIFANVFHIQQFIDYKLEFTLLYLVYILNLASIQFSRGIGDIKGTAIAGTLGTFAMIITNLLFLLVFRWGLIGYFIANIFSFTIPVIYLTIRNQLFKYFSITELKINKILEKKVMSFCIPLIFTTLSWTVNNLSDRFIVTFFCGITVNGIYSIAYKIPAILNSVQAIFIEAWQISAIKECQNKSWDVFFYTTYESCHSIMVILCSFLIISTKILASILFSNDFFGAWIYVPVLLLYILFNALSGTIGGVFTANKDSTAFSKSAIIGVIINIILNFVLVYYFSAMGAAIATVFSSIVIWSLRLFYSKKYLSWNINLVNNVIDYILLAIQATIMILVDSPITYLFQVLLLVFVCIRSFNCLIKIKKNI